MIHLLSMYCPERCEAVGNVNNKAWLTGRNVIKSVRDTVNTSEEFIVVDV